MPDSDLPQVWKHDTSIMIYKTGLHKFSYTFELLKLHSFTQMDPALQKVNLLYAECLATLHWNKRQRLGCKTLLISSENGIHNCEIHWSPCISKFMVL